MENKIKELNKAVRTLKGNCKEGVCELCCFNEDGHCGLKRLPENWEEIKEPIELTQTAKGILELTIKKGYKFITRDEGGAVHLHRLEPHKSEYDWTERHNIYYTLGFFGDLFPFVKWEDEEPTKINDVLENCVVIEEKE